MAVLASCHPAAPEPSGGLYEEARATIESCEAWVDNIPDDDCAEARAELRCVDSILQILSRRIKPGQGMPSDTLLSDIYRVLGRAYLDYSDCQVNHEPLGAARPAFEKALSLRKRHFTGQDLKVSRIYHNIGNVYYGSNYYQKALDYGSLSRSSYPEGLPPNLFYCKNLLLMGLAYTYQGDPYTGMSYLDLALEKTKGLVCRSGKEDTARTSLAQQIYRQISDNYRQIRQYSLAFEVAKECLGNAKDSIDRGKALLYMGNALQDSALLDSNNAVLLRNALRYTRQARDSFMQVGAWAYYQSARNLGELYRRKKDYAAAGAVLREALVRTVPEDKNTKPDTSLIAELKINLGEVFLDQGRYKEALAEFEKVCQMLGFRSGHARTGYDTEKAGLLVYALDNLVRIHSRSPSPADLERAAAYGADLTALIGQIRAEYVNEEAKQELSRRVQPLYRRLFGVHKSLYRQTGEARHLQKAFDFSEYSKYANLLKGLQLQNIGNFPAGLQHLKSEVEEIWFRLAEIRASSSEEGPERESEIQQWMDRLRRKQEVLQRNYPEYAGLLADVPALPFANIRDSLLYEGQDMLSYFAGDDSLYVFWIGRGKAELRSVAANGQNIARSYERFLSSINGDELDDTAYRESGTDLYRYLFLPVEPMLSPRVVVVPDASFANLPFEALPLDPEARGILLDGYHISYAFSANLLWEMRKRQSDPDKQRRVAVFHPFFKKPEAGGRSGTYLPKWLHKAVLQLEEASRENEIRGIQAEVGVQTYVNREASKKQFWDACRRYHAVHIATHGYVGSSNPEYNFILFSQDGGELKKDHFLFADEFYAHPLGIEFAFFSACQTAQGKLREGEGQFSIARGLAFAGVKSFITTLWSINSDRAGDLAPMFYKHLSEGRPKDEALTLAKREFIQGSRDNAAPYFWAGLTLVGDAAPLPVERPAPHSRGVAVVVFLALAGLLWFQIVRSKQSKRAERAA